MTLREMVSELESDQRIKIGAENGHSFFFCGTAGQLQEEMEIFEESMKRETTIAAERTNRDFVRSATDGFKWGGISSTKAKSIDDEVPYPEWTKTKIEEAVRGIREVYLDWLGAVAAKETAAIEAERLCRTESGLAGREVINHFMADPVVEETPTMVIIIHGWEYGRFWTFDEWKKRDGNQEDELDEE